MTVQLSRVLTESTAQVALRLAISEQRGLDHIAAHLTTDDDPDGLEVRRFLVQAGFPHRSKLRAALAAITAGDYVVQAELDPDDLEVGREILQAGTDLPHPGEAGPVEAERGLGGTRSLGPEVIATAEGPGEPGSVLNWAGANYVPQDYALQLERQLRTERGAGARPDRHSNPEAAVQWWLDRMAEYVERGKASATAKLPRYAKQLEEAAANLLQGLDEEAKRAQVQAKIDKLEAQLAKLRSDRTKTIGVRDYDPKAIRAWAKANSIDVPDRGRIPADIVARWKAANPEVTA